MLQHMTFVYHVLAFTGHFFISLTQKVSASVRSQAVVINMGTSVNLDTETGASFHFMSSLCSSSSRMTSK